MATETRFYFGISETHDGDPEGIEIAPLHDPIKALSITGDFKKFAKIKLPAAATVPTLLWSYTEQQLFEAIALVIEGGEGYLHLAWEVNKPVSTSDLTPDPGNTCRRVDFADLSCFAPFVLSSDDIKVNPVIATAAGVDGSGYPALFTSGATVAGRVYKLWAMNTGTTDVYLNVYVRN